MIESNFERRLWLLKTTKSILDILFTIQESISTMSAHRRAIVRRRTPRSVDIFGNNNYLQPPPTTTNNNNNIHCNYLGGGGAERKFLWRPTTTLCIVLVGHTLPAFSGDLFSRCFPPVSVRFVP